MANKKQAVPRENLTISTHLKSVGERNLFRTWCAIQGKSMSTVLREMVIKKGEEYKKTLK